jgi:hypothetical protein
MRCSLILFLLFASSCYGADVTSVLKKVQEVYGSGNMSYSTKYSLFKGHKSTVVHTSYEGEVYSYNKEIYQKIGPSEFIYGSDYFLHVSHEEKAMILGSAQQTMQQEVDLSQVLNECKSSELVEQGEYYKLTFRMKQMSGVPCSVILVYVNKKDYTLHRMDLYYNYFEDYSEEFGEKDMHQPHLKIEFTSMNLKPKERKDLFVRSNYLKEQNSALTPTGACLGYELIDQRN